MKKILLLCTLLSALTFSSCGFEQVEPKITYATEMYLGELTVIPMNGGATNTWGNSRVDLVWETDGSITLWLLDTRFVPQMPIFTMAVPHISYAQTPSLISMLGDNIDPYIGGTPYKQYRITALSGTLMGDQMNVSFTCMGHRVTFIGYEIY